MTESRYLLDNNALMSLGVRRIRSEFFREHCAITKDVLVEAGDHQEHELLMTLTLQPSVDYFENIRKIMRQIEVGDLSLIDLYKNQGTADPGLLATLLEFTANQVNMLLPQAMYLVTNDAAVLDMSARNGIATLAPHVLSARIDASL